MKKQLPVLGALLLVVISTTAQKVGIGTFTPAASAQLDISSNNKGLLMPRISLKSVTDNTTIASPAASLMVYNTNAALPNGVGYYYWNSGTWVKLMTATAAGGDLSGNYPNPVVSKLNNTPIPATPPGFNESGRTLRFNMNGTYTWDYANPIEYYEDVTMSNISLYKKNGIATTISRWGDGASLIPVCYGNYIGGNSLSGNTNNVTVSKFADGIYQFSIDPTSMAVNTVFDPVFSLAITGSNLYGFISAYKNGPFNFVVNTRSPSLQAFIDFSFSFVVYNR